MASNQKTFNIGIRSWLKSRKKGVWISLKGFSISWQMECIDLINSGIYDSKVVFNDDNEELAFKIIE